MKPNTNFVRLFPVFILILAACTFANTGTASTPTPAITPSVTNIPLPGDLGFGDVIGKVTDALTGLPVANATVTCEHTSYTSNEADRCNRTTTADQVGAFRFEKVFFHDTDSITLTVEAPGYQTEKIKQAFFTLNHWEIEVSLKQ